jgi:hypothetical protein
MSRTIAALILLSVSALPLASDVICDVPYAKFVQALSARDLSGARLADLNRRALRIFDACDSGHIENPETMLRALEKTNGQPG